MDYSTADLANLFGTAVTTLSENRQQVNDLDGYNGNHGDNMVHNVEVIRQALQARKGKPPAAALKSAAKRLQKQGRGGTSQYYAQGLTQAAGQLGSQPTINNDDVMTLLQSILGSVPSQGGAQAAPAQSGAGSVLGTLLGMAGGAQPSQTNAPQSDGLGLDDLLSAGARFMQAKQAGSDNMTAITQAAMGALMGSQPLQSGSPQAAAGGLIAQSVLGALLGRK